MSTTTNDQTDKIKEEEKEENEKVKEEEISDSS